MLDNSLKLYDVVYYSGQYVKHNVKGIGTGNAK